MRLNTPHPAIPNLSESARHILYAESTKNANVLLHYLQSQKGVLAGARRYSEAILLVSQAFQTANFYQTFSLYMDLFHLKGNRDKMIPEALKPVYSIQHD